jgi:hypothetical protein
MNRRHLLAAAILAPTLAPIAARASSPKEEKKKGGGLSFIQIQTLIATIERPGGKRGVITVETGIDVADAKLRERAEQSQPRLRAAFNGFLSSYVAGLPRGAPVNADYLSRALQRQTDIVLGRPGAKLLLGSILMN